MIPYKDALEVKLKKTVGSFLFHQISKGDCILGPPPQLNGVEFFKRGKVDAVTLHYLEKNYPLWKPKLKFYQEKKKVDKCPW